MNQLGYYGGLGRNYIGLNGYSFQFDDRTGLFDPGAQIQFYPDGKIEEGFLDEISSIKVGTNTFSPVSSLTFSESGKIQSLLIPIYVDGTQLKPFDVNVSGTTLKAQYSYGSGYPVAFDDVGNVTSVTLAFSQELNIQDQKILLQGNVGFYPNGAVKSGHIAKDYHLKNTNGKKIKLKAGSSFTLDSNGLLQETAQ